MRKKIQLLSLFCLIAVSIAAAPAPCQLGKAPADPKAGVDWATECLVKNPSVRQVTMASSKGNVACNLPATTPLVVDRETGIVKRIYGCGNTVLEPKEWRPEGEKECGSPQPQPVTEAKAKRVPPPLITPPPKEEPQPQPPPRVEVEGTIAHSGEITHTGEVVHKWEEQPPPPAAPAVPERTAKRGWWSRHGKWFVPLVAAVAGGSGYAFARMRKQQQGGPTVVTYQPLPPPIKR